MELVERAIGDPFDGVYSKGLNNFFAHENELHWFQ